MAASKKIDADIFFSLSLFLSLSLSLSFGYLFLSHFHSLFLLTLSFSLPFSLFLFSIFLCLKCEQTFSSKWMWVNPLSLLLNFYLESQSTQAFTRYLWKKIDIKIKLKFTLLCLHALMWRFSQILNLMVPFTYWWSLFNFLRLYSISASLFVGYIYCFFFMGSGEHV